MAKEKGVIVAGTEAHERTRPNDKAVPTGRPSKSDGKPAQKPKPKSKIIAEQ
jgi:hypothetical protein